MWYLNEQAIREAVSMKDVIDAIDAAYKLYAKNEFRMPERMQVQEGDNTLLLMPCLTETAIGTKLVTLFPNNIEHPTLHGLIILNDSQTGEIKSIIDGSFLTGLRTGAIGGSAVRHLAGEDVSSLAIIGTGVQGLYQSIAACTERKFTDIYLYNRSPEKIPSVKEKLYSWLGSDIHLHTADSAEAAVQNAEVIITATTSKTPVLPDDKALLKDKLVIGVGSFQPDMREFPKSLYEITDSIYVDTDHAVEESGDLAEPLEKGWIAKETIENMADFLAGSRKVIKEKGGSIVFKSTGMALFDVVVGNLVYEKALEKGAGTKLN
ncbi:ornithine cyclodeaminase family protein [Virgibacillus sp. YIM 98842]|uniref:ornithine cyclodeaminase family protein n=1 Tax=Virgibacillus sp. YIM 98842 TaxID=2663533 RepID=UPI0013DC4D02|nr:ornithine cyclodeaminase family protein [Virgibacillus sp. YIM 98842]